MKGNAVIIRKKRPPSVKKLLSKVIDAARSMNADFRDDTKTGWLPLSEDQVNPFIVGRTTHWRETALIQPLQTAIALLAEGKQ
jgi:hypothetical protein